MPGPGLRCAYCGEPLEVSAYGILAWGLSLRGLFFWVPGPIGVLLAPFATSEYLTSLSDRLA